VSARAEAVVVNDDRTHYLHTTVCEPEPGFAGVVRHHIAVDCTEVTLLRWHARQYDPHAAVLTVAAGVPYKNVDLAMRATARAGFKMIWCGDGPLRQELLELASTLFRPGFFLWTKVAPHEMVNIYSSADVFTLGSEADQEAYGLVYLEAMASGLRCVATDDAIRREACGEDAEYVNPRDFRQYAEALERVWSITKAKGPISWDPGPHSPEAVALSFSGLFREMVENEV
jgi:glycosyltransferase involved in cell wall biosynthesis